MSKGIFITGTGTDVGKTYITALLIKKLRDMGLNAGYYKAALSGATYQNGKLIAGDAKFVCEQANIKDNPNHLVSYIYEHAVSPHLAAQLVHNPIELPVLLSDFTTLAKKYDYLTVEGSGGIVCPLRLDDKTKADKPNSITSHKIMLTDIIKIFHLDILIVASSKLGTINSTILTVSYAKNLGINVKGIILNEYEPDNYLHIDNKKQVEALTGLPIVACVTLNASDLVIDEDILLNLYEDIISNQN